MSCCHLLLSGFCFRNPRAFTASACVSSDDARMSRRNIWEQSGNKSSSHVLSSDQQSVNLLHGFIVNRSDVAFRLTFLQCMQYFRQCARLHPCHRYQQIRRPDGHTESWLYAVTSVWDATATVRDFSAFASFEWFAAAFIHPFGNADRMIAVFAVNPART